MFSNNAEQLPSESEVLYKMQKRPRFACSSCIAIFDSDIQCCPYSPETWDSCFSHSCPQTGCSRLPNLNSSLRWEIETP